ncbi:MAG TPA: hypothetical protein PKI19_01365 [Elusimicrobiales bacterium]|nr:hypothetical protein [Elusimicrobiales bacterium]
MLREEMNIRQVPGDPPRRWWSDEYFDLIVWFAPDKTVWGFQLCYDRDRKPRALTWTRANGYTHSGIDDGEGWSPSAHKGSPILVADGLFDTKSIGDKLAAAAGGLPPEIRSVVLNKVRQRDL